MTSARKFLSAAKAAASHTGASAGMDAVYDAAFHRAGILRVRDLAEVFNAVETLAMAPHITKDDLVILTNGGGAGVLATDTLLDFGGMTELSPQSSRSSMQFCRDVVARQPGGHHRRGAGEPRYAGALTVLLEAPGTNAILVISFPTATASSVDGAIPVTEMATRSADRFSPTSSAPKVALPRGRCSPGRECRLRHPDWYAIAEVRVIIEVPSSLPTDSSADETKARAIVAGALSTGDGWLAPDKVFQLLSIVTAFR